MLVGAVTLTELAYQSSTKRDPLLPLRLLLCVRVGVCKYACVCVRSVRLVHRWWQQIAVTVVVVVVAAAVVDSHHPSRRAISQTGSYRRRTREWNRRRILPGMPIR